MATNDPALLYGNIHSWTYSKFSEWINSRKETFTLKETSAEYWCVFLTSTGRQMYYIANEGQGNKSDVNVTKVREGIAVLHQG